LEPTGEETARHVLPSSRETMIRPSEPVATTVLPCARTFVSVRPAPTERGPTGLGA